MSNNIYEILNYTSFKEEDYNTINGELTDLEIKNIKITARKSIKTSNKKKYLYTAASLALILTIGTFSMKPAFAQSFIEKVPAIDAIYEKLGYYKDFKDMSDYVGLSQEKNGYKFTIDKLMADDESVMIAMRIYKPGLNKNTDADGKKNDLNIFPMISKSQDVFMSGGGNSQIIDDDNTLLVYTIQAAPSKKVPKRFDMDLFIRNLGSADTLAKFTLPVSRENTIKDTVLKDTPGVIHLPNVGIVKINRVKISPLGSSIRYSFVDKINNENLKFYLHDDKGRIYEFISGGTDDSGYYFMNFTPVERDAKKLYISASSTNLSEVLDDQKKALPLPADFNKPHDLSDLRTFKFDSIGSITINKIEKGSDNIKFHFALDDTDNLIKYDFPIFLYSKTDKGLYSGIPLQSTKFYKDLTSKKDTDYIIEFTGIHPYNYNCYTINFPRCNTISQGEPLEVTLK